MTKRAATADVTTLSDAAVAQYLEAFPEFFERNPALLQRLRLPDGRGSGTTVSLLEKQVDVLRERNRQLEKRLAEFIEVARGNDELAAKIHKLTTRLVHARGVDHVVDAVEASPRATLPTSVASRRCSPPTGPAAARCGTRSATTCSAMARWTSARWRWCHSARAAGTACWPAAPPTRSASTRPSAPTSSPASAN